MYNYNVCMVGYKPGLLNRAQKYEYFSNFKKKKREIFGKK